MIDLEQRGVFRIGGDTDRVAAFLRHAAAELATGSRTGDVEIIVVGLGDDLVELDPDRLTAVASLSEAVSIVEHRAAATREALDRTPVTSVIEGRLSGVAPDSWLPTIVLSGTEPDADASDRLAALPHGAAVAVAVLDTHEPDATIDEDGALRLPDVRGEWQATQLTESAGTHLATLLGTADLPARPAGPALRAEAWADDMLADGRLAKP